MDPNRKTNIPIRKGPAETRWLLENSTIEQLEYLRSLGKSSDFKLLAKIVANLRDYNVYAVFEFKARSEVDLLIYRAEKRGEVESLDSLLYAIKLADDELRRRRLKK